MKIAPVVRESIAGLRIRDGGTGPGHGRDTGEHGNATSGSNDGGGVGAGRGDGRRGGAPAGCKRAVAGRTSRGSERLLWEDFGRPHTPNSAAGRRVPRLGGAPAGSGNGGRFVVGSCLRSRRTRARKPPLRAGAGPKRRPRVYRNRLLRGENSRAAGGDRAAAILSACGSPAAPVKVSCAAVSR